ncbi:hypothetical protein EDB83DRAFT_2236684 [Lactarius deliciosus]|nr:hypothetical protein EDB83DRAFT_2236684 [Lactarius deliciosus]
MIHLLIHLFSQFHYGRSQLPLEASVFPLAVRSPYLNCWGSPNFIDTNGGRSKFDPVVLVRVNNETFLFVGDVFEPNRTIPLVNLTSGVISPTQTMFIAEAGPMQINLTFLNPIEPGDWVKQSIPLSYVSLTAKSLDGAAHAVQVYLDISPEWNQSQEIYWVDTVGGDGVVGYIVLRQDPTLPVDELSVRTEWGILYNVMKEGDNITRKHGDGSVTRLEFLKNGVLADSDVTLDPDHFNPDSTIFAMSRDLGAIQLMQDPIVWVIGYTTNPVINYTDISGTPQKRSFFYKTQYPNDDGTLIYDFMNDFANASSRAQKLDQRILQDAAPISGLYGYLVSFATAQVYGNTLLTVATDSSGEFNKSDVMAFITLAGGRVNPVEKMYFAFPAFMYIDPDLGGLLLEPLFRLQGSPKYTNPYAAQDLGASWNRRDLIQGIDYREYKGTKTGNMLIMTYAHARASGNRGLISRYYDLLTSWADFLSNSTLFIHDQYSGDGLSTDNQTGLAIKGIIAIKAMSQMSLSVNMTTDFEKYSGTSSRLYAQWKSLALTDDKHLLEVYGDMKWSSLGYDLFPDLWLNTSVVESSVGVCYSAFLDTGPITRLHFGIVLTSMDLGWARHPWWNLFMAAMTPNQDLRTNLISMSVNDTAFPITPE